uniref:PB1 domain-containing protein n=1 Tax=Araucaria cunninghamii TaxID=56994 RepID=A0A0D6QWE2_ARACU
MASQEQMDSFDGINSSPRSVGGEEVAAAAGRVRFMCSYGGRILPRPHDNQLRYVGGDTRIVAVNRNISYSVLISKLSKICGSNVTLKYQLPNEDLDALISVTTDEDLENMMDEYDRLNAGNKSSRLRLFLFPAKLESATSLGSLLEGSKREHWFVDALNGVPVLTRGRSEVSSVASEVPDYLFGLDSIEDWDRDDRGSKAGPPPGSRKSRLNLNSQAPEVRSAPDSPVPQSSPYGSTSSAPPYIYTHGDAPKPEGFDPATSGAASDDMLPAPAPQVPVPEIGLRTQDPRLVLDDHMAKIVSKPDAAKSAHGPISQDSLTQEFRQVQIGKQQPEAAEVAPAPAKVAAKGPPMKREGSQSSLTGSQKDGGGPEYGGMRREGSASSLASLKREGSGSNLSAYGDDSRTPKTVTAEEVYRAAPEMIQQPPEHYVDYGQAAHYVQQGQAAAYWQLQDPQQADPSGHVYLVPSGAAPPMVQPMQRHPAYAQVQRIPAPVQVQAGPAVQKHGGVTVTQAVPGPYPAKSAPRMPVYRGGARPVVSDMRMMMRPPMPTSEQYVYQQVAYDPTNPPPQQVYYTQRAAVMNPQYQGMMAPVAVDLQATPEIIGQPPNITRVSQSF